MKTIYIFILFVVLALIQLSVPTAMVFKNQSVLNSGTAYKFKTRPIDPTDPFRGKYITLSFDMNKAVTADTLWENNSAIYVYLKTDNLGYAAIKSVSPFRTNTDDDFVIAKTYGYYQKSKIIQFRLPFDRFYMEESKAYPAEMAYRKASRQGLVNNTYGLVYVKNGQSVLEDVFINDVPIGTYVEMQKAAD
ncbi:GDYXXLXY domain-containing protein [Olleya sp. HaHaR_3_96]|uniref:GDYXXLXY domain-containing protein n=1 Tax=Olleya sp. HaHaR_3_96 TaxID=2745560 RepID=UPI001C4F7D06|nr:GDYXXLXY domain-containing protein [Olleya sp. HaHaR_3_96]QXP60082.1 GDYXXLXY domain-containing protein [Olleya sp. HaHaR_3_96]